jgi:single-strand DNA-binding protein
MAEFCQNYLRKGTKILLEGQLQSRSYEAQDGSKRYVTEVNTLDIEFAESKKDNTQQAGTIQGTAVDDITIPF